jgi:hypothetical protein
MCATCGCNYINIDMPMATTSGDNSSDMTIKPKSGTVTAVPNKPKK